MALVVSLAMVGALSVFLVRLLTATPEVSSEVRLRPGERRLLGAVRSAARRTAPSSGRACVAWQVTVAPASMPGRVFLARRDGDDFALEAKSELALVRLGRPEGWLFVGGEPEVRELEPGEARGALRELLEAQLPDRAWDEIELVVVERILVDGRRVRVTGRGVVEVDPGGTTRSYREPPTRLVLEGRPGAPLRLE